QRNYATNFAVDLSDTNLSYFINVEATNRFGNSLLCGDRNITNRAPVGSRLVPLTKVHSLAWTKELHSGKGNLGFDDGRVDQFNNRTVGAAIEALQSATNWLAVP